MTERLLIALYLLLVLAAFAIVGAIDMAEQERTTLKTYISEHAK